MERVKYKGVYSETPDGDVKVDTGGTSDCWSSEDSMAFAVNDSTAFADSEGNRAIAVNGSEADAFSGDGTTATASNDSVTFREM